jgi:3-hydroxyisobutyrate dehydrogenase
VTGITPPATVAFIGLGQIGRPMCEQLIAAGHAVRAFDLSAEAVRAVADRGAHAATSPADAARDAEAVLLSLPDHTVVERVLFDADGVVEGLEDGAVVVDHSTCAPSASKAIAERLRARGTAMLDAPVSGGVARAERGALAILVGGPGAALERCRPLLERLGETVLHIGGSGQGEAAKVLNNLLSATTLAATVEAVAVGMKAGIDPAVLVQVFNAGTARSDASERKLPKHVLPRTFDSGFSLALMHKDLGLAAGLAADIEAPLRVTAATVELFEMAAAELPGADHTEVARIVERRAGVEDGRAG